VDAQYAEFVRVLGDLSRLVVLSIILERGLAFVFEHAWFDRAFHRNVPDPANPGATTRESRVPGLKGLIALGAALAVCFLYDFNVVGSLFASTQPDRIGIVMTAVVLAGGSAGAIAVFQGFLNMSKAERDARVGAQQAEASRARNDAEANAKEALTRNARAEAGLAEARMVAAAKTSAMREVLDTFGTPAGGGS
jgi:hypothetical protein